MVWFWGLVQFFRPNSYAYIPAMFKSSEMFLNLPVWDQFWCNNNMICKSVPAWREISFASSGEGRTVPGFGVRLFSVTRCCGKGKFHQKCQCYFVTLQHCLQCPLPHLRLQLQAEPAVPWHLRCFFFVFPITHWSRPSQTEPVSGAQIKVTNNLRHSPYQ